MEENRIKLIVVKFGGSVLKDGHGIRRAAEQVKAEVEKGNKVVVVVSALKGVTDQLLDASEAIHSNTPISVKDHIIRLGEEQSTRLVSSALNLIGVKSEEFTVDSPGWPLITDENFGDAEPLLDQCQQAVNIGLKPVIERGITPVVSGFVGRSISGEITTLGRGGTDTTATVLSKCLNADELILVKDVGGVFSADPRSVKDAEMLDVLSTDEAYKLSSSGAKVLHEKVFRHKNPELGIRLISTGEDLSGSGTLIVGGVADFDLDISDTLVHEFTLVGEGGISGALVSDAVLTVNNNGGMVRNLESNGNNISLLVTGEPVTLLNHLHKIVQSHELKGLSHKEGLHQVTVHGVDIEKVKHGASKIAELPSVHKVSISKTQITLTLDSRDNLEQVLTGVGEVILTL